MWPNTAQFQKPLKLFYLILNFSSLFSLLFCMFVLIKTRLHAFLIKVEEKMLSRIENQRTIFLQVFLLELKKKRKNGLFKFMPASSIYRREFRNESNVWFYREFLFRFLLLFMLRHPKWYAKLWKRIRFYITNERRAHIWLNNAIKSTGGNKSLSWGEPWISVEFPRQLSHDW